MNLIFLYIVQMVYCLKGDVIEMKEKLAEISLQMYYKHCHILMFILKSKRLYYI